MDSKLYAVAARKTRLAAQIDKGSAAQPGKNDDICNAILEDTSRRGRENTSVRPRAHTSRGKTNSMMKPWNRKKGERIHIKRGSAGSAPRHEGTPRKGKKPNS